MPARRQTALALSVRAVLALAAGVLLGACLFAALNGRVRGNPWVVVATVVIAVLVIAVAIAPFLRTDPVGAARIDLSRGPAHWRVTRRPWGTTILSTRDLRDARSRRFADRAVAHYARALDSADQAQARRAEEAALDVVERVARLDALSRRGVRAPRRRLAVLHSAQAVPSEKAAALAEYGYEQLDRDLDRIEGYRGARRV